MLFLCGCVLTLPVFGATYTSSASGAWTTGTNWSPNVTGGPTVNDIVIVNHAMTLASGTYTSWNGTSSITINNGGSISVSGNLTINGSGMRVTINAGGSLSVSGSFTVNNQPTVTMNGGQLSSGSLSIGSSVTFTVGSGATLTATGLTTANNSSSIFSNAGTSTINGDVSSSGVITNSGTLQVNGNLTQANTGNSTTNSGNLYITGNATANGLIQLNPGTSTDSNMIISGTLTVNANPWIVVGTNVSSCNTVITRYANLVVGSNLILTGSGDVTVNQNGRLAVFGNITRPSGAGSLITINCGGQVYVDGDINLGSGGGNTVTNNNGSGSPTGSDGSPIIGLYVNGTTTAQTVTGTVGDQDDLISNNNDFFVWIASQPNSPLPITLLHFGLKEKTNEAITLQWATASELNFDYFSLQRSVNGRDFFEVARIKGQGTSTVGSEYEYQDASPLAGTSYYRLESVDFDGYREKFGVVRVEFAAPKSFSIFPSPVKMGEPISAKLNFDPTNGASLQILDMNGSIVYSTRLTQVLTIVPAALKPGLYIARIEAGYFVGYSRLYVE